MGTKNRLSDLNDHLFAELERLNDEDLKGEELAEEISRAEALTGVASKIIDNASLVLAAADIMYNRHHLNISRNLLVVCSDIDTRCAHMAYLQLGLAGIPAIVCHQDTLSLKTWDVWETPAYIMQWLRFRNALGSKKQNSPIIEQI